jgi:hypothetical protein
MVSTISMKISTLLMLATAISLSTPLAGNDRMGARAALRALPPHFANEVVRLSADNGRPNPTRWYVLARNRKAGGLLVKNPLYSITLVNGQLSEAKRSFDVRQILNQRNFINLGNIHVDSAEAFGIAENALGAAGQKMRSASYQLTQRGPSADPIWEVWAYGKFNRYLGVVKLSAKSGDVISTRKTALPIL